MLYFEPFMGNNGQNFHIPAYTYKAWAQRFLGVDTVPGWDDNKTIKENIGDMLGVLKTLVKDVSKSIAIILDTMHINNIEFTKPVYTIEDATEPLYTGFIPYLKIDGTTATAFAQWSTRNVPLVATRDGSATSAGNNAMTLVEGADYLLSVQRDMGVTIGLLTIMKSYY